MCRTNATLFTEFNLALVGFSAKARVENRSGPAFHLACVQCAPKVGAIQAEVEVGQCTTLALLLQLQVRARPWCVIGSEQIFSDWTRARAISRRMRTWRQKTQC